MNGPKKWNLKASAKCPEETLANECVNPHPGHGRPVKYFIEQSSIPVSRYGEIKKLSAIIIT